MNAPIRPPVPRHAPVLLWIAGICAVLEAVFTLAESPFLGSTLPRSTAILYGAFWPGLLTGWQPAFAGQPVTMFISYAFVHGGFMHMLFNMLLLLHLGRESVLRLGQAGFALLYMLCAIGAAGAFALLNGGDAPMLGASGAVFGLFGATIYWDIQRRQAMRAPIGPALRTILGLVVMNVLLWLLLAGMLAWEAHLGGFVTGAVFARIVTPTLLHRRRIGAGKR